MTSRRPCWRSKQRNDGHVGGVKYSFGDWTLFLCKFLLLFHYCFCFKYGFWSHERPHSVSHRASGKSYEQAGVALGSLWLNSSTRVVDAGSRGAMLLVVKWSCENMIKGASDWPYSGMRIWTFTSKKYTYENFIAIRIQRRISASSPIKVLWIYPPKFASKENMVAIPFILIPE